LIDAWLWYEQKRSGLGDEWVGCVEAVLGEIALDPALHVAVHGEVRRALVRRFPYAVFYVVEPAQVLVLAVAHVRREPGYWLDRA